MGHCTLSAADCFKTNGRTHISQQEVSKLLGFNPFTVGAETPKGDGKGAKGDKGKKDKGKGAKAAPAAAIPAAAVIDTTAEGQETQPLRYRGSICMEHQRGTCDKGANCIFDHIPAAGADDQRRVGVPAVERL